MDPQGAKSEYNAFAEGFSNTRNRPWPEFELLKPYLAADTKLLDIGCGNGRLRKYMPQILAYTGTDISSGLLTIAKQNHPTDTFVQANMMDLSAFADGSFDVVTGIASFHHLLTKSEQTACMAELHRVLKPGGVVFLTTWKLPSKYRWANWLRGNFKVWNVPFGKEKQPRHYRWVRERDLQKLLQKAGFKDICAYLYKDRNFIGIGRKSA